MNRSSSLEVVNFEVGVNGSSAMGDARKQSSRRGGTLALMGALLAALLLTSTAPSAMLWAQEAAAEVPAADDLPAVPKGRLPAFYKDLVTEQQRIEIYTIQQKFNDDISKLAAQIKSLQAARDAEVETVLSDEQKAKLAKIREEAAAKRKSKAVELKATAAEKPTDAVATTTETPAAEGAAKPVSKRPASPAAAAK